MQYEHDYQKNRVYESNYFPVVMSSDLSVLPESSTRRFCYSLDLKLFFTNFLLQPDMERIIIFVSRLWVQLILHQIFHFDKMQWIQNRKNPLTFPLPLRALFNKLFIEPWYGADNHNFFKAMSAIYSRWYFPFLTKLDGISISFRCTSEQLCNLLKVYAANFYLVNFWSTCKDGVMFSWKAVKMGGGEDWNP